MRILFISDVYFPRVNGVSTSIQTFAHQLQYKGHDVTLVAPQYAAELEDDFRILRVPARDVPFDPEDRMMKTRALRNLYRQIDALKPDLVHIQTPFVAHYEGLRLARHLGVAAIETYHTYFEHYLENYLPVVPAPALRLLARRFSATQCRQVNSLIVPSQPMADVLKSYGITKDVHVIPTGIPMSAFEQGDVTRFRECHEIPPDRPMLLFVGRVAFEKNIGFLIDVIARVRSRIEDVLLVIAGEGPARESLHRQVVRRGLRNHVRFVGYLSRETDLPECYAAADAFVFASRTETQGLVLLEAMAAGTPVVTTAIMGTAAIMEDGLGGIVSPQNVGQFAHTVSQILEDTELRTSLSRQAHVKAAKWSDSALADRLLELYEETITAHPVNRLRAAPNTAGG